MTRGVKHCVDLFITTLQGIYFQMYYEGKKDNVIQLGVRPIQLWELALPETALPVMIKTLWGGNPVVPEYKRKFAIGAIQKMLGAQKLPKIDKNVPYRPIRKENVAIYPVGIKPDVYNKDGESI